MARLEVELPRDVLERKLSNGPVWPTVASKVKKRLLVVRTYANAKVAYFVVEIPGRGELPVSLNEIMDSNWRLIFHPDTR